MQMTGWHEDDKATKSGLTGNVSLMATERKARRRISMEDGDEAFFGVRERDASISSAAQLAAVRKIFCHG
jgi:hypothetical protein